MNKSYTLFIFIFLSVLFFCSREQSFPIREGFINTEDGVRLYYQKIGEGPEIIIIPAGMYLADAFKQIATRHSTILFYDQRGRGRSDAINEKSKLGIEYEISDLESVRQYFGYKQVSLIGWSYSGAVVALYTIEYPNNVKRVIQIGSIPPRKNPYWNQFKTLLSSRRDSSDLKMLSDIYKRFQESGNHEIYIQEYYKITHKAQKYNNNTDEWFRKDFYTLENERPDNVWNFILPTIITSFGDWDFREKLSKLKIPVLTIHGDYDAIPLDSAHEWSQLFLNGRFLNIHNAGHFPWLEQPEIFFPAVNQFLNGEWPEMSINLKTNN